MRRGIKPKPGSSPFERQINRVVDGAVRDAITSHPDFFALGASFRARRSIVKRVTGAVNGYLVERWGRSGRSSPGG